MTMFYYQNYSGILSLLENVTRNDPILIGLEFGVCWGLFLLSQL